MFDRIRVLVHLFAWAQVGVFVRLTVGQLFGGACGPDATWVPCVTSPYGALFIDLPINILGCFLMGLFVSSDVLSNTIRHNLNVDTPMAILPRKSALQGHVALHIGLRTGLCGSLTTFASWMLQTVVMIVGGAPVPHGTSQWVAALVGLYIGTTAATASLTLGQHIALYIYHHVNPGEVIPYGGPAPEDDKAEADEVVDIEEPAARQASLAGLAQRSRTISRDFTAHCKNEFVVIAPQRESNSSNNSSHSRSDHQQVDRQQQQQQEDDPASGADGLRPVGSLLYRAGDQALAAAAADSEPVFALGQQGFCMHHQQSIPPGACVNSITTPARASGGEALTTGSPSAPSFPRPTDVVFEVKVAPEALEPAYSCPLMVVDCAALGMLLVMTSISLWRAIMTEYDQRPVNAFTPHNMWLSVLFGPVGCYCRYYLARFNGKLPGKCAWLPAGTLAANLAACVLDYVCKVLSRPSASRGAAALAVLAAIISGFGGCLSTVSTWVVEIQKLSLSVPMTRHSYVYMLGSITSAVSLGLIIYGIPAWTDG